MAKNITIPDGFTKEYIQEIIRKWHEFSIRVDQGEEFSNDPDDWDEFYNDGEYIDRYWSDNNASICISTEIESGVSYVSETIGLYRENEYLQFYIYELEEMI